MGTYRKTHKQEAYQAALDFVAQVNDLDATLVMQNITRHVQLQFDLALSDAREVAAKAIRVERGRRIRGEMIKKSFDLSERQCAMLVQLKLHRSDTTEAATLRALIEESHKATFA